MYRFQVCAVTQPGETIALVGSIPEMGLWNVEQCVRLQTRGNCYPLWWVDLPLDRKELGQAGDGYAEPKAEPKAEYKAEPKAKYIAEYKYVRIGSDGTVEWEAWGANRWVPIEPEPFSSPIIVEDGVFGSIPPYPYSYFAQPVAQPVAHPVAKLLPQGSQGLKIVVIGSSVALGCSAWLLRGWAWHLEQALQQRYGYQLVNLSQLGANISQTIARFNQVVPPEQPDIVIIALSLGNEGLASSPPQNQRAIQQHFEAGLQQLVQMTRSLGAHPILGGVYPNGHYLAEHYSLLRETRQRMLNWDVPVLDWLGVLDDGTGRWKAGLSFDAAHPNTRGHQLMFEAIDLSRFNPSRFDPSRFDPTQTNLETKRSPQAMNTLIYQDSWGFEVFVSNPAESLQIRNQTAHCYILNPDWQALQTAFQKAKLPAGIYIAEAPTAGKVPLLVRENGTIATALAIPAFADLTFYPASHFFSPEHTQTIFQAGDLSLIKVSDTCLIVINQSSHEYNLHPMWQEVRSALKAMPSGVYEDSAYPNLLFRTLMIGSEGLESRVKAPAHGAILLEYKCSLADVNRVAILPLGDRCAVRMLLYKLEYDGPAFPFDLTRTTHLSDVADIIQNDFYEMWNPAFLHYNHDARRIYHTRWTGLSFAHEVEDSDAPLHDLAPVHERMRVRYTARSNRFRYTLQKADKLLFIRTGVCDRNAVANLVQILEAKCQGKPFHLLLISPQASDEFANLPNVLHYNLEFNPERMYEDLGHWLHCTEVMREILHSLGVSSKNLFWCPPNG